MKERNFALFSYLKWRDLPRFKAELQPTSENPAELKLTPDDVRLRHRESLLYYGRRDTPQPFLGYEHQDYCLLHEAVRLRFYEAVELILEKGGDLLQTEEVNNSYYTREGWGADLNVREEKVVLPTALSLIADSGDMKLLQIAFDYLCKRKLYLQHEDKPEYLQFIYDYFWELNLTHFTARCLCFDVGRPLPSPFVTPQHLKEYLINKGCDVRGIFFTAEDYLAYFLKLSDYVAKPLLSHALSVCQFSLETLQELYGAFKAEEMKAVIVDHNPAVDPEFAARLASMRKKTEENNTKPVSAPVVPMPSKKLSSTPQMQQQYSFYMRRIGFLADRITELTDKQEELKQGSKNKKSKDLSTKEKQKLEQFQKEMADKEAWLKNNPQYKRPNDNPDDERESPPKRSFFSKS